MLTARPNSAAQRGPALLASMLRCRRCGHKLVVHYTGSHHDVLRYHCRRGWLDNGEPRCIGFAGLVVDQAIAREILRVVQPAAIEAAVMAHEEQARKIDEVLAALERDLEAARYSARRAQKQYDAADPENRLVTDELERRWNQSLQRVHEIEVQIQQHRDRQGPSAAPTREEFAELAADLESLWNDAEADAPLADGPWVFNRETLQTAAAATLIERVTGRNRQPAIPNSEQATFEFSST